MGDAPLIVLDTQALLWLDGGAAVLGERARALLDEALDQGALAVSAISYCEAAWLHRNGRITLRLSASSWREVLEAQGVEELPLTGAIAIAAVALDDLHRDPADRLIVATALYHDAALVTSDRRILAWSGPLDRIDARR